MLDAVGELQSIAILALKIVPPQNKVKQTFVIGNVSEKFVKHKNVYFLAPTLVGNQ